MANEKRLTDANALEAKIERVFRKLVSNQSRPELAAALSYVCDLVIEAPTVDAVEVVHGYNIDEDTPSLFECSICHWSCSDTYYGDTADYNYCPNCGAKMDGDRNG